MEGLGYGLIKVGEDYHYNCNYKGYKFTLICAVNDREQDSYSEDKWDNCDENGNPIGEPYVVTRYYQKIKDDGVSKGLIVSYFNSNIKNSVHFKTWCANNFGKALGEVEFYGEVEDLKEEYDQYDWPNEVDSDGNPIPLNEVIGKTIKTDPTGRLMVLN